MGPKVSVCIPTYNRAGYLGGAIASVLEQTMQDFEIIVYDDASTDTTAAVVRGFQEPRIRYFRQVQRVGISRNRNSCLAVARGEYIGWLDSDDLYLPHMLKQQSAVLDAHPAVGLVHGEVEWIDEGGAAVGMPAPKFPPEGDTIEPGLAAFRELCASNYIVVPTVLVRRACYEEVGGYNPALQVAEDSEMWLRIALRYDLAFRRGPVARVRLHGQRSNGSLDGARRALNRVRSIAGIFAGAPRRHAGVRALHQVAVAGRLLQVLWQLHANYSHHQALRTSGWLAGQTLWAQPRLFAAPSYWRLVYATVRRDDTRFERAWRRLIEPPALAVKDTRQGRFIIQHHFAHVGPLSRILLRRAAERHYNPGAATRGIKRVQRELESAEPDIRTVLVAADHGFALMRRQRSGSWITKSIADDYFPAAEVEIGIWLERLRAEGVETALLPAGTSWAGDFEPVTTCLAETGTPCAPLGSWMVFDLRRFVGRAELVRRVRDAVTRIVPPGAHVLVVSKGDDDLVSLGDRHASHFPQDEKGGFAGWYPATDGDAIAHIEDLRKGGAEYLIFPRTSMWWLRHYAAFAEHLRQYEWLTQDDHCVIVRLSGDVARGGSPDALQVGGSG